MTTMRMVVMMIEYHKYCFENYNVTKSEHLIFLYPLAEKRAFIFVVPVLKPE